MPVHPRLVYWFCAAVAIYHFLVIAQTPQWFGYFYPQQSHRAVSIAAALILAFTLLPAIGRRHGEDAQASAKGNRISSYDLLLMVSGLVSAGFVLFFFDEIIEYAMYGFVDTKGTVFALMLAIPLLEAVRRTAGIALPCIILFFVLITIFQPFLPGLLYGRGYPLDRLAFSAYIGDSGIFGLPLGIAANIVIVFLSFGALMERAGASRWFMDMALALTGWSRGGPAKAAVVASAMFGSISGSPSGNSATTGIFTIPMMKQIGYTPAFAAAVEAVASTGGIILPPVMGSMAFIMAEWIDTTYASVVIAAATPAVLYFLVVFVSVHLQARKYNIKALPSIDLPRFWPVFIRGWFYVIPFVVLVHYLIVKEYPPGIAGIYASFAVVACSFLSRDRSHWLSPRRIIDAFHEGTLRWVIVAVVTASVGIMIGALELSGVGVKISQFIVEIAGGDLYLTLLLVGIVSLIVGMGLDATPAYITLATLMAPALIRLGVPDMAAHLYVIFWGLASFFTPPTCLAVFVTCGISGSRMWETGWEAVRLGISAFIIPVAFVLNGGLLLNGSFGSIAYALATAILGAVLLSAGIRGYAHTRLTAYQQVAFFAAGLVLIGPGIYPPLIGFAIAAISLLPTMIVGRAATMDPD